MSYGIEAWAIEEMPKTDRYLTVASPPRFESGAFSSQTRLEPGTSEFTV